MTKRRSSAAPLAALYAVLIVYASLSPFSGWKAPATPLALYGLGHMPWLSYWSRFDAFANLIGYMPFGVLLLGALVRSGRPVKPAIVATIVAGMVLSMVAESLQNYLPRRVPSLLDWLLNSAGTVLGAGVALAIRARGGIDRWQVLRERWFVAASSGGIALLLLWPIGLLFPMPVPFGEGQVLPYLQELVATALASTPWESWVDGWQGAIDNATTLSRGAELVVVSLGLLAPCFVVASVTRPGGRRAILLAGALTAGLCATTLSTALNFGPQHAFTWITAPVAPALMVCVSLAMVIAFLPPRGAAALGLVAVTMLIALVVQAPSDPYYAESLQGWEQGRFIRFHGLAKWIGWLWPYTALIYLFTRVVARDAEEAHS